MDFERYLKKVLTNADYSSLKESLSRPEPETPLSKMSKSSEVSGRSPVIRGRSRPNPIEAIKENMSAGDWVRRVEGLSRLKEVAIKSKAVNGEGLDCLVSGLDDSDSRVSMHTLTVISKVIPCITNRPDLSPLIPSLIVLLNSMNTLLRNNAKDVCRILMHQADLAVFLPALIKELGRDKDKSWLFLFSLLIDSLQVIHSQRPSLIKKVIVPYGVRLLNEQPVSITAKKFLEKLGAVVGDELREMMGESWEYYIKLCSN